MSGGRPEDLETTGELPTEDAGGKTEDKETTDQLSPGTHVGRYVTTDRIGAGGMGVVYRAHDPELNRRVALKLLRDGEDRPGSERRSRLLREAQALARLSHPNVVGVYDVGLFDDAVYLAMEFVEGQTLRDWLDERPRSAGEILAVLIGAGEGLAAAHAKGIVHRDFKPDNVMVDGEGRSRVVDFGLAREPHSQSAEVRLGEGDPTVDTFAALTRDGAILGTPGYMAPEQLQGGAIDARTDVFSFCVTLWRALYGVRPFGGDTAHARMFATMEGVIEEPPSNANVAPWLRRACERGLAVDPSARFEDMRSLLAVLRRGDVRGRQKKVLAGIGVVALAGAGVLGYRWLDEARTVAACDADGASIEEVWDPARKASLRRSFVAGGVANAEEALDKAAPWLDDYAKTWAEVRTAACRSIDIDETWTTETFEQSVTCLDERKMELDALVVALSRGDAAAVQRAVGRASGLSSPRKCGETDWLARLPPIPLDQRTEIQEVRRQLAHADALFGVGAFDEGIAVAEPALEAAEAIGWIPLVAHGRVVLGYLVNAIGDYPRAEEILEKAYFDGVKVGAFELAADSAEALVIIVGVNQRRHDDAVRWSQHAEAVRVMMPDQGGARRVDGVRNRASVRWSAGDLTEALALFEQAIELREEELGVSHPEFAITLWDKANVHLARGEYDEAEELLERSLPILEEALGPRHPKVAGVIATLANVQLSRNDAAAARELYERALRIQEEVLGPDHPELATTLQNIAITHIEQNENQEAQSLFERVLAIQKRNFGDEHPAVAMVMSNLAMLHFFQGQHAESQAMHASALKINEATMGPDHPELAYSLVGLAEAAIAREHFAEALPFAERAVALRSAGNSTPGEYAVARFGLARALWGSGGDKARALSLAEQARAGFEEDGDTELLKQVDEWLKSRKQVE